jgi:RNA polymerase sigma factor (TIGR02999 family)
LPDLETVASESIQPTNVGDITQLLDRWCGGDADAFNALVPLVYEELRKLANFYLRDERQGHTLQPTALVHEAFLRLRNVRDLRMENRAYFYGAAARVMRRVLVDYARRRGADKRGGDHSAAELTAALDKPIDVRMDLIALNDALDALEAIAPEKAKVIELRFVGGLTIEETADYVGIAPATVKRHIAFARAWLFRALDGSQ